MMHSRNRTKQMKYQKITDKYIAKIDGAVEEKTKEILTV